VDVFALIRNWFDWCFENPEKINPNHTALYFFCIEHCNRLGWKEKFGLPTSMAKEAIGIRNFRTYKKALTDLVDFGFIKMIEISKNQYSSNIIAIVQNTKAHTKALTKASTKHIQKQSKSIDSIDIPITKYQLPNTISFNVFWDLYDKKEQKDSCEKKWNALDLATQEKIILVLPDYVKWKNEKQYRPNPQTFLNQKRWLDEIPKPKTYTSTIPEEDNKW
jgi:hypothetical protein